MLEVQRTPAASSLSLFCAMCFYALSMRCPVPPVVRTRRQGLPDPEPFRGSRWGGRAFLGSLSQWRCEMLRAQRMNSILIRTSSHLIISIFFLNAGCSTYAPVWQVGEAHSSPSLLVEEGIGHRCSTSRTKRSLCAVGAGVTVLPGGLAWGSSSWASSEQSRCRCAGLERTRGLSGQVRLWRSSQSSSGFCCVPKE